MKIGKTQNNALFKTFSVHIFHFFDNLNHLYYASYTYKPKALQTGAQNIKHKLPQISLSSPCDRQTSPIFLFKYFSCQLKYKILLIIGLMGENTMGEQLCLNNESHIQGYLVDKVKK